MDGPAATNRDEVRWGNCCAGRDPWSKPTVRAIATLLGLWLLKLLLIGALVTTLLAVIFGYPEVLAG